MKIPRFIPLILMSCIVTVPVVGDAATVPNGTTLVVKTASTISSRDSSGKPFKGNLLQDVQVGGKVVLAAGTPVAGVVESPQVRAGSSTRPLSLKLTQISVGGRMVPVKTESFTTKDAGVKGQHVTRVTGGAFLLSPGTSLQFRLSEPLSL